MGQKRKAKLVSPTTAESADMGVKHVRLDIDIKNHQSLRVIAALCGMSMASYCKAIVIEAVREQRMIEAVREQRKPKG